jgi:DivIVA domain-containing protein
MPLTPAEVHSVVFSKSPIGERSYDEDEVDAFLDLVEAELTRLIAENDALRSQLDQLDQQQGVALGDTESAPGPPEPSGPVAASLPPMVDQAALDGDPHTHAARVLGLAQQMADRLTGQAQAEADAMLSQARAKADQLLGDAKAKAEDLVEEARTRAEALLTDARVKAETVARQSQEKTAVLEQQTARQHSKTIAVLNREKNALENKIDRLRALERDYRVRLKSYLTAQLYELDGDETGPPPAPLPNLQSLPTFRPSAHAEAGPP